MNRRSSRLGRAALAVLATGLATAGAGVGVVGAAATPRHTASWRVSKSFPPATTQALDSTCATASSCAALMSGDGSSVFLATANGGASWKALPFPPGFGLPSNQGGRGGQASEDLACPSASDCLVLGFEALNSHPEIARTTDAGVKWTLITLPTSLFSPNTPPSLACPSASTCLAISSASSNTKGVILRSTNGGSTWALSKPTSFLLDSISCASATSCGVLGAGSIVLTANGGKSWTTKPMPAKAADAVELECPTTSTCLASGDSSPVIWTTADAGTVWHASTLPRAAGVGDVSCGSATACEAVGIAAQNGQPPGMWRTTTAGGSWKAQAVPPASDGFNKAYAPSVGLNSVVCHGADDCLLFGTAQARFISFYVFGFVVRTLNGGGKWTQPPLPIGIGRLGGVSCASISVCEVVGSLPTGIFLGTTHAGSSWVVQLETVLEVGGAYLDVACSNAKDCAAVGGADTGPTSGVGAIAMTTDGGAKWSTTQVPSAFSLSGVACPSAKVCFAVGFASTLDSASLLATTDGGSKWTEQSIPAGVGRLTDVACASTKICEADGDSTSAGPVIIGTSNGSSWKKQSLPAGLPAGQFLDAVACSTTKVCVAGGGGTSGPGLLLGTSNAGASWKLQKVPADVGTLLDVSCGSAKVCEAGGQNLSGASGVTLGTANSGTSWKVQPLPGGVGPLSGLSCPSTTVCYASALSTRQSEMLLKLS